jgi:hypothetical protein
MNSVAFASGAIVKNKLIINLNISEELNSPLRLRFFGLSCVKTKELNLSELVKHSSPDCEYTLSWEFELPAEYIPLVKIELEIDGIQVAYSNKWFLSSLYPASEDDFNSMFHRRRNRIKDLETLVFSIRQILDHFKTSNINKSVASVIYAYRLIDTKSVSLMGEHCLYMESLIDALPFEDDNAHPRFNSSHQIASLYRVLVHMYVAQRRYADITIALDNFMSRLSLKSNQDFYFGVAFNACPLILFNALVKLISGKKDNALELIDFVHRVYIKSLASLPSFAIYFSESKYTLDSVIVALKLKESILADKKPMDAAEVYKYTHRVQSQSGIELLESSFHHLWKHIRLSRRAKSG